LIQTGLTLREREECLERRKEEASHRLGPAWLDRSHEDGHLVRMREDIQRGAESSAQPLVQGFAMLKRPQVDPRGSPAEEFGSFCHRYKVARWTPASSEAFSLLPCFSSAAIARSFRLSKEHSVDCLMISAYCFSRIDVPAERLADGSRHLPFPRYCACAIGYRLLGTFLEPDHPLRIPVGSSR
jgi:hypothetical protein